MATATMDMSELDSKIGTSTQNAQDISTLQFIKLKFPNAIPYELIESVKGRTFTVEQFYAYQNQQFRNPYNHLYALIDDEKKIQGYLWAEVNILDGSLFVNTFSISKTYWGKGKAIEKVKVFLKELKEKVQAPRVFWISTNEKFFSKHGFKRSRNVLMEYLS